MKMLIDRLSEPSSWASIAAVAGSLGLSLPDEAWKYGAMVLAGIAGLLGFLLKEKAKQ